jgi:predicted Zn-ribbon and HTH transcriptional regulator
MIETWHKTYCKDCGKLDDRDNPGQCRKCSSLKMAPIPVYLRRRKAKK